MFQHRLTGTGRSASRRRRATSPTRRLYRGMNVEGLEVRMAPAVQIFSGLEFMTTGAFNVSNDVVTTSSPVQVGVAPATGETFTPLLLLQDGVEFNSTDSTGTFSTPPSGGSSGLVSAYAGGTTYSLLDAPSVTFEAPELLSTSSYDVLSISGTNTAALPVAGADVSVTALRFNGSSEVDVQGNLSFADFPGLSLSVGGDNDVALTSAGVSLTGLSVTIPSTSFTEAGLSFTATNLQATYSSTSNAFELTGSATLAAAGNTLVLTLGGTSEPGLVIENGTLESLDATVTSNIAIGGLTLTAKGLTIQATGDSNLTVTGSASLSFDAAGNPETIGLTLGSGGQEGLVIDQSTGDLVSFDATVTTSLTIAGLQINTTDLNIAYQTGTEFEISGNASFALDGATVDIDLGGGTLTSGTPTAGLLIENGTLEELDAAVTSTGITVGGVTITTTDLTFDYEASNPQYNNDPTFEVSGTASVTVGSATIDLNLGAAPKSGAPATAGLLITGGELKELDAAVTGSVAVGGLAIKANDLTFDYSASNPNYSGASTFEVSGAAMVSLGSLSLDLDLGGAPKSGAPPTAGLLIVGGELKELDAAVTGSVSLGGLAIKANDLTFDYSASNPNYSGASTFEVSGAAMVSLGSLSLDLDLGGAPKSGAPATAGLLIVGGELKELDAAVTGSIGIGDLSITARDLTFDYNALNPDYNDEATFEVSGSATVAVGSSTIDLNLGGPPAQNAPPTAGLLIVNGTLEKLDAAVTGSIGLGGLSITAKDLTFDYNASNTQYGGAQTFEVSGAAMVSVGSLTLHLNLGGAPSPTAPPTAGLLIVNGSLKELDAAVTGSIGVGGLSITAKDLTFDYNASNTQYGGAQTFEVSGAAMVSVGATTIDLNLGGAPEKGATPTAGLLIVNGTLEKLDAAVTASIGVGGLSLTAKDLTFDYSASNTQYGGAQTFEVSGAAMVSVGSLTLDLNLGAAPTPTATATAGLLIVNGSLKELDAAVTGSIGIGGLSIAAKDLTFDYNASNANYGGAETFEVSGTASVTVGSASIDLNLGGAPSPTATPTAGLLIVSGSLEKLDAAVTGSIGIGGLSITARDLTFDYSASNPNYGGAQTFEVSGSAMVSVGSLTLDLNLGAAPTPTATATAGLLIVSGSLKELDAAVTGSIGVGGLSITAKDLTFDYSASNPNYSGAQTFEVSGTAMVSVGSLSIDLDLGAAPAANTSPTAGLLIVNGSLDELDAAVTGNIGVGGLSISANDLTFDYNADNSTYGGAQTFIVSGGASFSLAGATVGITLGGTFSQGLVIVGGQLRSLEAAITSNFSLLGMNFQTNGLTVAYSNSGGADNSSTEFVVYGGVSLSSSFLNFSTTLGNAQDPEQDPGIEIVNGKLESLDISVSGGFSLFGFQVQATGLAIQYSMSTNELELSGGIMLDFTSAFEVSAAISQGGLFINTQTGALSIPSTGLQITASATLGPFSIQNLMISFSNGPSGINFSASGAVDLPGGIDVDLTQLVVQNGQLDDIGLSVNAPIPIGDTGFFIDSMSGDLQNLNNISQLVVSASAQISFGDPISVPSLGPIFAGGTFYLVDATGSITVSASELDLSGSVSILGGLLGQGSASLDLDWATGVYSVSGNFSMYDGIFNFGGSLTITSAGDITLLADASVNVPPQIPFIGGDSLGSINFLLQYDVGAPSSQDFAAAWTTFSILSYSFTIGFEVDFSGNISIIDGSDVAALTASAQQEATPSQYVYQSTFTAGDPSAPGSVPVALQYAASSPMLDGAFPYASENDSLNNDFLASNGTFVTGFQLSHQYAELDSVSFTISLGSDVVGTGGFNPLDQFYFDPNGNQPYVPKSATLDSGGELDIFWSGGPSTLTDVSIDVNYLAAEAYYRLMEPSAVAGVSQLVAVYTITPVDNDPGDTVQTATQADLLTTLSDVPGYSAGGDDGGTDYDLSAGQAVPQTASFTLYSGQTLLGTGYFNASGNLIFDPNGTPSMVPLAGSLSTLPDGDGVLNLRWPGTPPPSSAINITYATTANQVIDFPLPSGASPSAQYTIELIDNTSTPLSSNDVPAFSATTLYKTPTVSITAGSVTTSSTGVLSGTLDASAYTPEAVTGNSAASVTLYYNTTDSTMGGTLIGTYPFKDFAGTGSNSGSYQFSFPGFANLPAGSYYLYAIINDGENAPVASPVSGPYTEASPSPAVTGPQYLALTQSGNTSQGVFSSADGTALGITTNFSADPVTVSLSVSGGGDLVLGTNAPAAQINNLDYASAAAAAAALNGLEFESNSSFTGSTTLTISVSTTINGTTYYGSDSIPLLTPNTPLEVAQTVDSTIPSDPSEFNLTVTVTNNSDGPDAQDGTGVQLLEALSPGLSVVSATPSEGTFDDTTDTWTIGSLPLTGANSVTLSLVLQEAASAQGQPLTSSAVASSALFDYPASAATSVVSIARPHPITITVTNLNDSGSGSLRSALEGAENGDTIDFATGLAGTITLTSGELLINQDVTIIGSTTSTGAPAIVISGGNSSRVFDIEGGTTGVNVTLENLDIEHGLASGTSPNVASAGGGLLVSDAGGTVTVSNVLFSGNVAQGTATTPAQGGGVAFLGGTGTFSDDTFANNQATAASGGAAAGGALAITGGNLTLITDTIADNTAGGGTRSQGGGISASGTSSLTLSNDTIADNTAGVGGDVDQAAPAFVEAINSVFATSSTTATDPDFAGTVAYSDHNLVDNTAGSTGFSAANGDLLDINADLAALGNNGGPLPTMPPLPGSPLIDAGDTGLPATSIPALVGLWLGDGNANDATGGSNGTLEGGASYGSGEDGTSAFLINGGGAYVSTSPDSPSLSIDDVISVSAIINLQYYSSDSVIIDKTGEGNAASYRFGVYTNGELYFYNGSTAFFSTGTVALNTFTQVGFTLDNATQTLDFYINGQSAGTATATLGGLNSGPVWIGHDLAGGYFAGTIQDVAVYHGILTAAQMNVLTTPEVPGGTDGATSIPGLVSLIGVAQTTQAQAIPGLVSDWQGNGNASDATGTSNASLEGGATYGAGEDGTTGFVLNGTTAYVATASNPASLSINDVVSVSAIVDLTAYSSDSPIIDKSATAGSANYRFGINNSGELYFSNGSAVVYSSGKVSLDTFTQVGFTLSGATDTLTFYINGLPDSTQTISFGALNTAPVWIGHDAAGGYFHGTIEDVAVYHAILTGSQMALLAGAPSETVSSQSSGAAPATGAQGTVEDLTGNDLGVTTSAVTIGSGVTGEDIQFSGTTSAVSVADSSSFDTADFTISGWFTVSAAPATGGSVVLATKSSGPGNGWTLSLGSNLEPSFSLSSSGASATATSSQALSLDTWYDITGTFDGTAATLYVNGTAVATATLSGGYATSTGPLVLGAAADNPSDFYGGQGNALDSAGTSNGTVVGNVTYTTGVAGQAFDFSGVGDYISLGTGPDIVGTGAFTVAVWVNTTASGTEYILNQRDSNNANGEYVLQLNDGQVNFWTNANNTFGFDITSSETVNNGQWHLIVAERLANGTGEIFIDGALAASGSGTPTSLDSGLNVYIGEDVRDAILIGSDYDLNYQGKLEGVQIYRTALSASQVAALQTSLPLQLDGDTALTTDNLSGAIDDFAFYDEALLPSQIRSLAVTGTVTTEQQATSGLTDFYAGQGNALDGAGANDGTIVGNVSYSAGVVGQAFDFSGQGNYVALGTGPDIVGTGAFTVAVWVNTTASGTEYILNQRDSNNANGEYVLQLSNGQVNFWTNANNTFGLDITSSETVNNGQWHLIVAERLANGTGEIFIDGVLAASASGTPTPLESGLNVYIGEDVRDAILLGSGADNNYEGKLEGVQIYDTALTTSQIANLQTALASQIMATTDERGDVRQVAGGLDIGADEYQYDLTLTATAPVSVPPSDLIIYTFTVTNSGPDSVAGATLTDILPSYVTFQSMTTPPGWNLSLEPDGLGTSVTATDTQTLASGGTAQFTLVAYATSTALYYFNDIYDTASVGPTAAESPSSANSVFLSSDLPNGLGLLSEPTSGTVDQPLSPTVVNIVDNDNNTVTTDSAQVVTLSIASGPAGAVLSGPTTLTVVNGIATFTGLSVNLPGTYVLVGTGGNLTPIDTDPFTVAPVAVTAAPSPTPSPVATTPTPAATTPTPAPVVVTSGLTIHREPPHKVKETRRASNRTEVVKEKVTIKDTSRQPLTGPLVLRVNGLLPGESVTNASGSYQGDPYIDVLESGQSLAHKKSRTVTLDVVIDGKAPRNLKKIYQSIDALEGL